MKARRTFGICAAFIGLASFTGCGSEESPPSSPPAGDAETDAAFDADAQPPQDAGTEQEADAQPEAAADAADSSPDAADVVEVTILHTAEERGRLDGYASGSAVYGGAANVLKFWTDVEQADPATHLILSAGNSWTGPPTSTWSQGEAVVDAFNAMGYAAASIGARDFDFGRDVLDERVAQAAFPLLAANLRVADTGAPVDFAQSYIVVPVNGVQVGVIGLLQNPNDVNPLHIADLVVDDYVATIDTAAADARQEGAQIIVVLSSERLENMVTATGKLSNPVDVVFAGRSSTSASQMVGTTPVLVTAYHWNAYHKVVIAYDLTSQQVVDSSAESIDVAYPLGDLEPDAALQSVIDDWNQDAETALGDSVGYSADTVPKTSWAMGNWVTDAWLWSHPDADIAIQNSGGCQASVASGTLRVSDFYSLLPFENNVYEVEMTGDQVREAMNGMLDHCTSSSCTVFVGGIYYDIGEPDLALTFEDGTPVEASATYSVLVNSYMYGGGAGFPYDAGNPASDTGDHMRDPVIAWTQQLGTSDTDPLQNYLDFEPRDMGSP